MQKKHIVDISNTIRREWTVRNFPRISSLHKSMLNLSCYPKVLNFEQLKSKKTPIRGRPKETSRTVSLRLRNGQTVVERAESATGKALCHCRTCL